MKTVILLRPLINLSGHSMIGSVQGQAGLCFEQPDLVGGVYVHGRRVGTR